jgi:hypothetical protein
MVTFSIVGSTPLISSPAGTMDSKGWHEADHHGFESHRLLDSSSTFKAEQHAKWGRTEL